MDQVITTDLEILNKGELTKSDKKAKRDHAKYLDKDYINHKLNKINNHSHRVLFKFLWMSGVRISEALSLTKKNIDFENHVMTVKWLKSRRYNYRNVPLHPTLRDLLQIYTAPMLLNDRIFPITRQRAHQLAVKYFGCSPHQFRHSFAVNWLRCKGELIILHKILGHSKVQTTMEYLKIVPVDQGKELLKIDFG